MGESQTKGVCDHGEKRKEVESGEDLRACWKAAVGPSWEMDSWLGVGEGGRIKFDTKTRCYWRSKMGGGFRRGGGGGGGAEGDDKGQEEEGSPCEWMMNEMNLHPKAFCVSQDVD